MHMFIAFGKLYLAACGRLLLFSLAIPLFQLRVGDTKGYHICPLQHLVYVWPRVMGWHAGGRLGYLQAGAWGPPELQEVPLL